MTGRVCPVHGEYAESGVCRWCEPKTLFDVALSGPKVRPLPVAEPTPWAKKPSGADQSSIALPPLCMCQKCGRGFDAPVPLTSLLCPECRDKAQPKSTDVVGEPPGASSLRDIAEFGRILGPPPDVAKIFRTYKPEYLNRIGFTATEPCLEYAHAQEELRLAEKHSALRWERVARRWNWKHRRFNLKDCDLRVYDGLMLDALWTLFFEGPP